MPKLECMPDQVVRVIIRLLLAVLFCASLKPPILAAQISSQPAEAKTIGAVRVESGSGQAISPTFMGLSHEWFDSQRMMGSSRTGVNQIYRQLLKNLLAYGSGPVQLRIGGNSTDRTKEPTPQTVEPFADVARSVGAKFTLGVNLGSGNVKLAADQTQAYLRDMPPGSVDGIEIGNEPDEYFKNGLRQSTYRAEDYFADFDAWKAQIVPLLPSGTRLVGPSWAFPQTMRVNVRRFVSTEAKTLSSFSQHYYATNPQSKPADDFLLTPRAATSGPAEVAAAVATMHSYGVPFRMGEFSSISNEGVHGVSDTFASALWAVDTMFEYANVGVDGVNWEASSGNYDNPFYFNISTSQNKTTYTLKTVCPLYYGLLLFQAATGNNAHLVSAHLSTQANLKAWATVDATGTKRLVLINKDKTTSGMVSVTAESYRQAVVMRLTAPSYTATEGVAFAGQTFDRSTDGTLQGTRTAETIKGSGGVFQIPMAGTSAALITFNK